MIIKDSRFSGVAYWNDSVTFSARLAEFAVAIFFVFDCQICNWFDLACFLDSQFAHEVHACFDGEDYDAKVIINEVELTTMIYIVLLYGLAA